MHKNAVVKQTFGGRIFSCFQEICIGGREKEICRWYWRETDAILDTLRFVDNRHFQPTTGVQLLQL